MLEELQSKTNRKVSAAKLYRALVALKDDVDNDDILNLINNMP